MVVGGAPSLVCLWLGLKHMTIIVWHGKSGMLLSWEHREETGAKTSPRQEGNSTIMVRSRDDGMHACILNRFSHVRLFVTVWIVAHQAPLSMGFSRQEYWSGLHAFLQEVFQTQGKNPCLLHLLHWQAGSWLSHGLFPVPRLCLHPQSLLLLLVQAAVCQS